MGGFLQGVLGGMAAEERNEQRKQALRLALEQMGITRQQMEETRRSNLAGEELRQRQEQLAGSKFEEEKRKQQEQESREAARGIAEGIFAEAPAATAAVPEFEGLEGGAPEAAPEGAFTIGGRFLRPTTPEERSERAGRIKRSEAQKEFEVGLGRRKALVDSGALSGVPASSKGLWLLSGDEDYIKPHLTNLNLEQFIVREALGEMEADPSPATRQRVSKRLETLFKERMAANAMFNPLTQARVAGLRSSGDLIKSARQELGDKASMQEVITRAEQLLPSITDDVARGSAAQELRDLKTAQPKPTLAEEIQQIMDLKQKQQEQQKEEKRKQQKKSLLP